MVMTNNLQRVGTLLAHQQQYSHDFFQSVITVQ